MVASSSVKIIFHLVITSRNIFFALSYLFVDGSDVVEIHAPLNDVGISAFACWNF